MSKRELLWLHISMDQKEKKSTYPHGYSVSSAIIIANLTLEHIYTHGFSQKKGMNFSRGG